MGQSLEKYRDVKLQEFRRQLASEDSHVSKLKTVWYEIYAIYICFTVVVLVLFYCS